MAFYISKLFWLVAQPGHLMVLGLVLGAALLFGGPRARRLGRGLTACVALVALAVTLAPLGEWLAAPLEARHPMPRALPARVDGIVVLGGGIDIRRSAARSGAVLTRSGERVTEAAALARRYPDVRLIYASGAAAPGDPSLTEADVGVRLLTDLGIDPARLTAERRSRNTAENAAYSHDAAAPEADETWLLVTSAWHMPRAIEAFRAQRWEVVPFPVDHLAPAAGQEGYRSSFTEHLYTLTLAAKEWVGLLAYRLLGWGRAA